jgi:hypothetical protein
VKTAVRSTLTSEEVVRAADTTPELLKLWTKEGTIPKTFYTLDDGRSYRYHAATVALFELATALASIIGSPKVSFIKHVLRAIAPDLPAAWSNAKPHKLAITGASFILHVDIAPILERARAKVASLD